jgi:hypothetical protein
MAEQCSGLREKGAHCLSVASLRVAGVGEPRRAPEELAPAEAGGHATANMVLGPFAETKGPRRMGTKPHRILKDQVRWIPADYWRE